MTNTHPFAKKKVIETEVSRQGLMTVTLSCGHKVELSPFPLRTKPGPRACLACRTHYANYPWDDVK